ncbi:integrase [Kocuria sp. JC486]|uniref:Integrase n=1 Tax=Kocuria soli TaxID=2485125 RepID=A0A3N3ZM23_9MICC|nr:integrase [Kocuria soli]NHU85255.1 integrase [Kocuria sp. JC486]ROZ61673.1 integrase [Kocuria soli]
MELSIGLPEGLLLKLSGGELTLFEKDWTTVRRQIDLSILEGAPIADITWSHKLWAAVVAVPDRHQLFRWDAYTNALVEFAGTGEPGRRDGRVAHAKFAATCGTIEDSEGRIWLVDRDSSSLRYLEFDLDKGDADPHVVTVIGRQGAGYVDGEAGQAKLSAPESVHILYDGSVVVADTGNNAVRVLDLETQELRTVLGGPELTQEDTDFTEDIVLNRPYLVEVADGELWVTDDNGRHHVEVVSV